MSQLCLFMCVRVTERGCMDASAGEILSEFKQTDPDHQAEVKQVKNRLWLIVVQTGQQRVGHRQNPKGREKIKFRLAYKEEVFFTGQNFFTVYSKQL